MHVNDFPATEIDWVWDKHGPFSNEIYGALRELTGDRILHELLVEDGPYPEHG